MFCTLVSNLPEFLYYSVWTILKFHFKPFGQAGENVLVNVYVHENESALTKKIATADTKTKTNPVKRETNFVLKNQMIILMVKTFFLFVLNI